MEVSIQKKIGIFKIYAYPAWSDMKEVNQLHCQAVSHINIPQTIELLGHVKLVSVQPNYHALEIATPPSSPPPSHGRGQTRVSLGQTHENFKTNFFNQARTQDFFQGVKRARISLSSPRVLVSAPPLPKSKSLRILGYLS